MEEQKFIAITDKFSWSCLAYNHPRAFLLASCLSLGVVAGTLEKFHVISFGGVITIAGTFVIVLLRRHLKKKVLTQPRRYKIVPSWLPYEWEDTLVSNDMTPSTKAQYWFASQNIAPLGFMPPEQRIIAFAQLLIQYKRTNPRNI